MTLIKNIKEVTEPLKEQIMKGDVHTIDEIRAWLKHLGSIAAPSWAGSFGNVSSNIVYSAPLYNDKKHSTKMGYE